MPDDETPQKPEAILYFEAGTAFFESNYMLLGHYVADAAQQVGEVSTTVQRALDRLAIATADRMRRIMDADIEAPA